MKQCPDTTTGLRPNKERRFRAFYRIAVLKSGARFLRDWIKSLPAKQQAEVQKQFRAAFTKGYEYCYSMYIGGEEPKKLKTEEEVAKYRADLLEKYGKNQT